MTLIPQRTVVSQIASQLQEEIQRRTWKEWLPNERLLCEKLQVSRSSLRLALDHLRCEKIIVSRHGIGHQIVRRPKSGKEKRQRSIGLLLPDPLEPVARFRPSLAFWIDELKAQIQEFGCDLRLIHGRSYYQSDPDRALRRLLERERHDGWILALTTEQIQRHFMENRVPCVVAGSLYEGIELPSVDLDYRAICYHAVGELLRLGHRRIALLNWRARTAGDTESEKGFLKAVEKSGHGDVEGKVIWHNGTMESVTGVLDGLVRKKTLPTAFIVANAIWYLATVTVLARHGLRIPKDVSLISRNDEPFLDFVAPSAARYTQSPHHFTKKLLTLALQLAEGLPVSPEPVRLVPKFTLGGSIGPLPGTR